MVPVQLGPVEAAGIGDVGVMVGLGISTVDIESWSATRPNLKAY